MQGVRKRLESEARLRVRTAWETAVFVGAAWAGKLKPLSHYIATPARRQTGSEMLAILREFQAKGAKMKIKRIKRE